MYVYSESNWVEGRPQENEDVLYKDRKAYGINLHEWFPWYASFHWDNPYFWSFKPIDVKYHEVMRQTTMLEF